MIRIFFAITLCVAFSSAQTFRIESDDVVIDASNHVMWQDNADVKNVKKKWQEAIDYCHNLSYNGYNDWRLPIMDDFFSIRDESRSPAIINIFQNVELDQYWSASDVYSGKYGWSMNFKDGDDNTNLKNSVYFVRCIRSVQ